MESRCEIERNGVLQGCIISGQDAKDIYSLASADGDCEAEIFLIIASQSCDIANQSETFIEFSVAKRVDALNGNFTNNKNPRRIHLEMKQIGDRSEGGNYFMELFASNKIIIPKEKIDKLGPKLNKGLSLSSDTLDRYTAWLASRYRRPALPTEFDRRLDGAWSKNRRLKETEKLCHKLIGIYIRISPDKEINDNEVYQINMLILREKECNKDEIAEISALADLYVEKMEHARCELLLDDNSKVKYKILTEDKISVSTMRGFKRFYLDNLSYKNGDSLPSEVS